MDEAEGQKPKLSWLRTLGTLFLDLQWVSTLVGFLVVFLHVQQWMFPSLIVGLLTVYGVARVICKPTPGEWLSGVNRSRLPSGQAVRFVELRVPQQLPRLVYVLGLLQFQAAFSQLSFTIFTPEDYFLGARVEGLWKLFVGFYEAALVLGYTVCFLRMKSYTLPLTAMLIGLEGIDLFLNRPYWARIAELMNQYSALAKGRAPVGSNESAVALLLISAVGSWVLFLVAVLWHRKKFVR